MSHIILETERTQLQMVAPEDATMIMQYLNIGIAEARTWIHANIAHQQKYG